MFVSLGLAVSLLLSALGRGPQTVLPARQQHVLVAARDLAHRTPISAEDVAVANYAADDVPPGALLRREDARGLSAAVDILKGQPLTSNLLIRSADAGANQHQSYLPVPPGFVAITVPTSEQTGVAGYIRAGDYIALVAVVPGVKGQNVQTVFSNVHVIKVGASTGSAPSSGPSANLGGVASSLTVVVTSCQAEFINWFLANAFLRYELEASRDYQPRDGQIDQSCPSVSTAAGVTPSDVSARWPGIGADLAISGPGDGTPDPLHPNQSVGCGSNNVDTRPSACGSGS